MLSINWAALTVIYQMFEVFVETYPKMAASVRFEEPLVEKG
jgi:hypothetical protein